MPSASQSPVTIVRRTLFVLDFFSVAGRVSSANGLKRPRSGIPFRVKRVMNAAKRAHARDAPLLPRAVREEALFLAMQRDPPEGVGGAQRPEGRRLCTSP